jgi:hypothetical protein
VLIDRLGGICIIKAIQLSTGAALSPVRQKSILLILMRSDYVHLSYMAINVISDVTMQFVFLNVVPLMKWFRLEFEADVRGSKSFQELLAEKILFPLDPFEGQLALLNDLFLSLTFARRELFEHLGNLDWAYSLRARVFAAHTVNYASVTGVFQLPIRVLLQDG